ncbi:MAG TPA: hypothetical protein VJ846_08640 [Sphingomicrobium sp.]|nr:hypothetical protein [Sphingomicrobium sp.]
MHNPFQRLYQTKLALMATIATAIGLAMQVISYWLDPSTRSTWFVSNLGGLGAGLLGIGLLGVLFQYVGDQANEQSALRRTRTVLRELVPEMRDAVIQGFAFNPDDMARVANPVVLDQVARNVLALQLGDRNLADDAYTDLRNQVIQAPERWHDVSVSIALAPWEQGTASGPDAMFVATLRWEYRTIPAASAVRFACVADQAEYRELLRDPTIASVWYFGKPAGHDAGSRSSYELVEFMVNGQTRPIRRTQRTGSQVYNATIPKTASPGTEVTISCTYRVLVKQQGHLLYLDLPRPTKGLHIQLAYGGCGIRTVNPLDFIASSQQARVSRTLASAPSPSVDIGFDGWVFPRSGVAFVWSLENERAATP